RIPAKRVFREAQTWRLLARRVRAFSPDQDFFGNGLSSAPRLLWIGFLLDRRSGTKMDARNQDAPAARAGAQCRHASGACGKPPQLGRAERSAGRLYRFQLDEPGPPRRTIDVKVRPGTVT